MAGFLIAKNGPLELNGACNKVWFICLERDPGTPV